MVIIRGAGARERARGRTTRSFLTEVEVKRVRSLEVEVKRDH